MRRLSEASWDDAAERCWCNSCCCGCCCWTGTKSSVLSLSMLMRLGSPSLLTLDASESRFFFDTFLSFSFRRSRRLFKNPWYSSGNSAATQNPQRWSKSLFFYDPLAGNLTILCLLVHVCVWVRMCPSYFKYTINCTFTRDTHTHTLKKHYLAHDDDSPVTSQKHANDGRFKR